MKSVLAGYEELLRHQLSTLEDNTNLGLNNFSHPTRPHSIIVKYQIHMQGKQRVMNGAGRLRGGTAPKLRLWNTMNSGTLSVIPYS